MSLRHPVHAVFGRCPRLAAFTAAALLPLATLACGTDLPSSPESMGASYASLPNAAAPFPAWHQGFNNSADGWYGNETEGPLGWCGSIELKSRTDDAPEPSAGAGHATVSGGACNAFWSGLGIPYGAPYAPGPGGSAFSSAWPAGGFVTELDIYLDPAWAAAYTGTFDPGTLVDFSLSVLPLDPAAGSGPYYFVPVETDGTTLSVMGHDIPYAGWYTFRFLAGSLDGEIHVTFELAGRIGGVLVSGVTLEPFLLAGPFKVPFAGSLEATDHGSGYAWFFDLAFGLELPIDEYQVRRGR